MDFTLTKEPIHVNEVVFDGQTEQGVEFDYILPDYYPDIFKILKCSLTPKIISHNISGDKLICDGVVYIKVLYLGENSNSINCVEQRYTYSKTIDLAKNIERGLAVITPKVDYCNCRAVSGRRLDVRGAVSCKVKVSSGKTVDIITGADGNGMQSKTSQIKYSGKKLIAAKQFIVREDIETGSGKGGITGIIHYDAVSVVTDCKIIANKVILKGEAQIKALYMVKQEEESETEVMEAAVPLSQIIDIEGITEQHTCFADMQIMACDLTIKQNDDGENRIFGCDLTVECNIMANSEQIVYPITDIYSTAYESNFTTATIKTETNPQIISQSLMLKEMLECSEGEPASILDCWCNVSNLVCKGKSTHELVVTGQADYQAIAKLENGMPVFIEKTQPFELVTEVSELSPESRIEPILQVASTTYSISSGNQIDMRVSLNFRGCLYQIKSVEVIKEIVVNEDKPKAKDTEYGLKLYYADENEDVWSIAKRYNTSAEAIMVENDLESEILAAGMLLIPIL